jgi:hypothetical protein
VSKFPIVLLYRIVTNLIHAYAAELVARKPRNNLPTQTVDGQATERRPPALPVFFSWRQKSVPSVVGRKSL